MMNKAHLFGTYWIFLNGTKVYLRLLGFRHFSALRIIDYLIMPWMLIVPICINSRNDLLGALTLSQRTELYNLHILLSHLLVEMVNGLSQIPKNFFSVAHLFGRRVVSNC